MKPSYILKRLTEASTALYSDEVRAAIDEVLPGLRELLTSDKPLADLLTDYSVELKAKYDLALQALHERDTKIVALTEEARAWRASSEGRADIADKLRGEVAETGGELERSKKIAENRASIIADLRTELSRLQGSIASDRITLSGKESELREVRANLINESRQVRRLRDAVTNLQASVKNRDERLQDAQTSRQRAEELLTYFKGRVDQHFKSDACTQDQTLSASESDAVMALISPRVREGHRKHLIRRAAVVHDVDRFYCECGETFAFFAGVVAETALRIRGEG